MLGLNLSWLQWKVRDLKIEWRQAHEEGRNTAPLEARYQLLTSGTPPESTAEFQEAANAFLDAVAGLPMRPDHPWQEPDALEEIRALRPAIPALPPLNRALLPERFAGAWLGRCAGCLLGKPVEGWKSKDIQRLLVAAGRELPDDYLWKLGLTREEYVRLDMERLWTFGEGRVGMPVDDDTNYTVTGLALMEQKGRDFTPAEVAQFWLANIPLLSTCTAERVAYRNFIAGLTPPESARVRNPYREWIGAQIRADFFGYAAAADPERAAEYAWRDASISHVKNGIYGEMWVAAMLAAAAVETDIRRVVVAGLAQIPARSRLAEALRRVLDWKEQGQSYEQALAGIRAEWDEYEGHDWCHTISNAMIVALALLWGESDLTRTLAYAVYPGFDTDCNGATAGSVAGMLMGAQAFDRRWSAVIDNTLHTSVMENTTVRLNDLVTRTLAFYQ